MYQLSSMIAFSSTVVRPAFWYNRPIWCLNCRTGGCGCSSTPAVRSKIGFNTAWTCACPTCLIQMLMFSSNKTLVESARRYSLMTSAESHSLARSLMSTFVFFGTLSLTMAPQIEAFVADSERFELKCYTCMHARTFLHAQHAQLKKTCTESHASQCC